ncbi:hypothetical protein CS542_08835 [Pedobacter sp. IW39]|nr:hypothetical protein CS542_08835 [Pedobacter sp. IW39]
MCEVIKQYRASDASLDPVFADFSAQGVTDLIVDLRYNGGYVNTASYLTNLIAPSGTSGQTMFTELYNPLMQAGNATILANQPLLDGTVRLYVKTENTDCGHDNYSVAARLPLVKGSLGGINNIVFIVTRNTASASEIVINSLNLI